MESLLAAPLSLCPNNQDCHHVLQIKFIQQCIYLFLHVVVKVIGSHKYHLMLLEV